MEVGIDALLEFELGMDTPLSEDVLVVEVERVE